MVYASSIIRGIVLTKYFQSWTNGKGELNLDEVTLREHLFLSLQMMIIVSKYSLIYQFVDSSIQQSLVSVSHNIVYF